MTGTETGTGGAGPLDPAGLEAALRRIGAERYHNLHPFHRMLHAGECTIDQVRAWALNRYCYQRIVPLKDSAILARMDDTELRREWRRRIVDHDGEVGDAPEGGLRRWLALTDALGFDREYVSSMRGALPAVRFACEAYLHFVRERSLLEAITSSLTELFAPTIIAERVEGMIAGYDFISRDTLRYFQSRLTQAPKDSEFALQYAKDRATTVEAQRLVLDSLHFKCGMLWAQLDAIQHVYVNGAPAPGAWRPGEGMRAGAA